MEYIALRAGLGGDGGFKLYGVADLSRILRPPISSGILLNFFFYRGNFVFSSISAAGLVVSREQRVPREVSTR